MRLRLLGTLLSNPSLQVKDQDGRAAPCWSSLMSFLLFSFYSTSEGTASGDLHSVPVRQKLKGDPKGRKSVKRTRKDHCHHPPAM